MADTMPTSEQELREQAVKRLKKKRDFRTHLASYVVVNAFLIAIWALTGAGFFWPGFVLAGWGVGLLLNAREVYGKPSKVITEDQIQREMEDLKKG